MRGEKGELGSLGRPCPRNKFTNALASPPTSESIGNPDDPAGWEEMNSLGCKRVETRNEGFERADPKVRQPDAAPQFPEGRSQPALSKRTAVLQSLTEVPQGEPGITTEHYGDASMMSANRIAFLPHLEPLQFSSLPKAQFNSVVLLLENSALRRNPKILGSGSVLQP